MSEQIPGWIIRLQSGFFAVQTDQGLITCKLRGRLKKGRAEGDIVAVGDRVKISLLPDEDGVGVIEKVEERKHSLIRLDPRPRGEYQQVLLANLDQVVLVFACAQPEPRLRMLDRFLVIAESQEIPVLIVANKTDLLGEEAASEIFDIYTKLGYALVLTSARTGTGIQELNDRLKGKISAFVGPSGVGKSSLLNAIQPDLGLMVNEVSQQTLKGKHTTVVREMFRLKHGGYVADLPGIKSLAFWDIEPEELDAYFPELRDLVPYCKFSDCTHVDEPDCAVLQALEEEKISEERYYSYLRMRFEDEEFEEVEEEIDEEYD